MNKIPKQPTLGIKINGATIPWSFVMMVKRAAGDDWDTTIDAFWKCRNVRGYNGVQKYVMKGLLIGKDGKRYILENSKEKENGKMDSLRAWFASLYERKGPTMSIQEIFSALASGDLK